MDKSFEENSTQKLLDLIRSEGKKPVDVPITSGDASNSSPSLPSKIKSKHLNLGVWITGLDLTLVMASDQGYGKKGCLIKWQHIPLPENLVQASPGFSVFLGGCLDNFLKDRLFGRKKISIWTALESSSLKIKNFTIPDVPQAKIANAAFWGLKKDMEFDESQEIFDFEILGDLVVDGIKKKNILAFCVPRDEVSSLKKTFKQAGYFLSGITSFPFAMQNFIRTKQIQVDEPYFALVNISRENTEISCFSQSGILLVRSLRTGSQSLVERVDSPLDIDSAMDPSAYLSSMTRTDPVHFSHLQETSSRLISKIMRTGDYCSQNYTDNTPINRYIFYGETDLCEPFMHLASTQIPAEVGLLEPIRENIPNAWEATLPPKANQRNSVLTAFGIALSAHDLTPNFLFTVDDRQQANKQRKTFLATALAGMILVTIAVSSHAMVNFFHKKDLAGLALIRQEQTKLGNEIPEQEISQAIDRAEQTLSHTQQYISNYLPLAIIFDVCQFTPGSIRLTSLAYDREKDEKNQDKTLKKIVIQGQVSGPASDLNSELSNYMLKLSESPVFGAVEIKDLETNQDIPDDNHFFTAFLEVL